MDKKVHTLTVGNNQYRHIFMYFLSTIQPTNSSIFDEIV